ncbi:RidA family protein [Siccirubricoccus sp. KC 17139]|uniref:RidA family protein n=1 Tax=Siccirubricoccus soli TaxID=2899147 RepID=A0ABT1D1I4_9PROT|nr:RidA family protein [Siccirubricoccus soli]MCO6415777.1 RidA family protein [Siccirubricoccus soli]MCP2681909.1 RidA family protein [Siccirubricoccus soli]
MSIAQRLATLGLTLPAPRKPAFGYVPVAVENGLAWVSGQLPWEGEGLLAQGQLGAGIDVDAGRAVARCCLLNGLAVLEQALGSLDRVKRVVKVTGFVSSAPGFYEQPAVVDGASTLLVEIFGEAGRHARSAVGVASLPRNVPVEIEFTAAIG